jgi:predicted phage terminase large subunit-like protein
MTRWHEDDLAGKILAHENDWTVIKLPYFRETLENKYDTRTIGTVLWPEKHNAEKGEQAKKNNSRTFAALYQQRPAPLEGGIFKRHWWKYYDRLPERISKLVMSWDCAFKGEDKSDYVVGMVLATSGINTYIVDLIRGRYDFPETVRQIQELCRKYPYCQEKYIEEKANGAAVIATLKERIPGLIPIVPKESKEARANAITYRVEGGNVFIPAFVPWKDSFLYEFSVFPNGANDDIVDAFTQAMNRLHNASHGQALRIAI